MLADEQFPELGADVIWADARLAHCVEIVARFVERRLAPIDEERGRSDRFAVEDLAAAQLCIARARERGVGTEVDL